MDFCLGYIFYGFGFVSEILPRLCPNVPDTRYLVIKKEILHLGSGRIKRILRKRPNLTKRKYSRVIQTQKG